MTIQTFSPLQGDGSYYLNTDTFDPRFMWSDTVTTINYIVCRLEGAVWKVIANGKLNGYNDGTVNYQYKFDFNNYIKIKQEKLPVFYTEATNFYSNGTSVTSCSLSLVLSSNDIFAANTTKITTLSNGEMVLTGSYIPSNLTSLISLDYVFHDAINGNIQQPSTQYYYTDSYIPFTVGAGKTIYVAAYDSVGGTIYQYDGISTINSKIFLFYIPTDCVRISFTGVNGNSNIYTYYPKQSECKKQLFYYSISGNLDMMYIEGNTHEADNITKDYITVNDQKLPINIKYQKQLKVNTGFKLNQEQIYSLIKTPYTFLVEKQLLIYPNLLNNSETLGTDWGSDYAATSNRTYPTINGQKVINVASTGTNCNAWVAHGTTFTPGIYYTISFNTLGTTPFTIGICENSHIFNGVNGRVSFTFQYVDYSYGVIYITIPTSGHNTSFYNFKLEKGSVPTPYEVSINDYNTKPITPFKRYQLDTQSFEGYVGSKLSERNIELLLSDEKIYKRKTNFDLTFWD